MAMMSAESLVTLEHSLRETLHKEAAESERRQKAAEIQKLVWEQRRNTLSVPAHLSNGTANGEQTTMAADCTVQLGKCFQYCILVCYNLYMIVYVCVSLYSLSLSLMCTVNCGFRRQNGGLQAVGSSARNSRLRGLGGNWTEIVE